MVPRATAEEDEVEEIERAEPQLQSVQILRKHGDEVGGCRGGVHHQGDEETEIRPCRSNETN